MVVSAIAVEEKLSQFVKDYVDDYYCLELFRFFGAYPDTHFNRLAIIHALNVNGGKLYVEQALSRLIDKGVIKTYSTNDTSLYSLTGDEPLHSLVLCISKLTWHQWQLMLHQSNPVNAEQCDTATKHMITFELAPHASLQHSAV